MMRPNRSGRAIRRPGRQPRASSDGN
jgi:hypothetical protein